MKARPMKLVCEGESMMYRPCEVDEATHLSMRTPGPFFYRMIPVQPQENGPRWEWNGDTEKPTLSPSIRARAEGVVCHSYIRDGQIQFLNDCTHELAGQTADLFEVD